MLTDSNSITKLIPSKCNEIYSHRLTQILTQMNDVEVGRGMQKHAAKCDINSGTRKKFTKCDMNARIPKNSLTYDVIPLTEKLPNTEKSKIKFPKSGNLKILNSKIISKNPEFI
jgi:hypothetical protein